MEMTGEFSGDLTESGAGCGLRGMLNNMSREEILEILSEGEGFCQPCEALLQSRVQRIMKSKIPILWICYTEECLFLVIVMAN